MITAKQKQLLLYWLPRVLCICAVAFISIFALDAFTPGKPLLEQIKAFLLHLIPSFILILFLLIAWKYERIGGILFIIIGLVFTPVVFLHNYGLNRSVPTSLLIILIKTIPFIVVGLLFLLSHNHKKKSS